MEIASKASKVIHVAAPLAGIAVGVTTAVNVAASKAFPNATFSQKLIYLTGRALGPSIATPIAGQIGIATTFVPKQGINPLGIINATSIGGGILLIVDAVLDDHYPGHQYVRPFLKSIGAGLLGGGVIGGLFDPNDTGTAGTQADAALPVTSQLTIAAPFPQMGYS